MNIALPIAFSAAAVVGYATLAPRSRLWGPVISRGDDSYPPRYALTFDDGPTAGATDRILDILLEMKAKATFFVIGANVMRSPQLINRMHDEEHLIANHSYDHSHFGGFCSRPYWRAQLERTNDAVAAIIGVRPALFRPPIGVKTWRIISAARGTGHSVITWNRSAADGIRTNSQRILQRLVPRARAGDIALLHDGIEPNARRDPSGTVDAVRPLIAQLRERQLEPVRLDKLLRLPAYQPPL
jgi:peptidoglycan/xylan/chitin deacetylase (PgdA/CDA1 family)